MTLDRVEVRVSIQKLLIALIIVIVPLTVVGLYITQRTDRDLERSIGAQFKTFASMYSDQVGQAIRDRISVMKLLAADPTITAAVTAAAKAQPDPEKIAKTEQIWNAPQGEPLVKAVMYSSASETLRRHRELDNRLLRAIVTDERGAVIAATTKPQKYSYAQDAAWHGAYADGKGTATIGDILFDDTRKLYVAQFAEPIYSAESSRLIGVLLGAMNVTDLIRMFQQQSIGSGARALLVAEDGYIISGPNVDVFAHIKSDEYGAIGESMGTVQGRQSGYTVADTSTGRRIIGFAETGLKQRFSNMGWYVLVSQDQRQATAPVRAVDQFALAMVVFGMILVTLVAVYYYLHRAEKFEDIEEVVREHERAQGSIATPPDERGARHMA